MSQLKKNKEFIMEYINAVSGSLKTRELLEKYNTDPGLVDNILFMDSVFPKYEVLVDEILAEGDRIMVRARLKGRHDGEFLGIPATHREVVAPYVVGYEVHNNKITHSWLIADLLKLVEQLGIKGVPAQQTG
jgi:predicted ester cyclase